MGLADYHTLKKSLIKTSKLFSEESIFLLGFLAIIVALGIGIKVANSHPTWKLSAFSAPWIGNQDLWRACEHGLRSSYTFRAQWTSTLKAQH